MGGFNSDDHYIYYYGQEYLRRNGVEITVYKRVQNAVLGCNLKNDRLISVHFQGKPFNITVFQVLKDDAMKVLYSICQQIWTTWHWTQDWKRSVFIPVPKKGNAKECSNYRTVALISHASKVTLKILKARLQ